MRHQRCLLFVLATLLLMGCQRESGVRSDIYDLQRRNMVRWNLKANGIESKAVLSAVQAVPRHLFLLPEQRKNAYKDEDVPIAHFLTTPKPYVAARTIELLNLKGSEKVLEIGTGRGYQAALLAEIANEVYTIEIVPDLFKVAERTLKELNYKNVYCRLGDGYKGWPEKQPFNAILVTAAAKEVPKPLLDQLAMGGRLVMAIGDPLDQSLILYRKGPGGVKQETIMSVRLPPMEGEAAGRALRVINK